MSPLDTLWHLLNFFAPAVAMGTLAPALAKLLWRRRLGATRWRSLSLPATAASVVCMAAGLLIFGRDGRVSTYFLMVVGCASGLFAAGFRSLR